MINKVSRGVGLLGLIVLLVSFPVITRAQNAGQALEISPPLLDLKADPGQQLTTNIKIRNVSRETLVAKAQYNDFVADSDETGNPKLLLDQDSSAEKSPYSIQDWITQIPNVTLQPGEQVVLDVKINVPKNASPGGHYGVIRFTGLPPEVEASSVSLAASIGTLLLVTVSGDVEERGNIIELSTSQNNKNRSIFEYGPITLTTRFQNAGNVHLQPSGNIAVTNMFGKKVDTFSFNSTRGNVLPQSIRKFTNLIDKKVMFGKYTIQADLVYGSDNTIISTKRSFWVIPYKLILLILAGITLIYIAIRRYNKYIIRRSQKRRDNDGAKSNSESE